ncbi:MAG: MFS transporter [Armatimonadota bacterium]
METKTATADRQGPAGMSRNVWAMGAVSFLTDFSTEMIYPLLPAFITNTLGASKAFLGVMEGLAESLASLIKLFSGALADKMGIRKPIVLAGYSLSSLSKPVVALATAPWHVLALRLADRTGKGIRTAPRDALLADSVVEARRGAAFGLQRTMDHAGAISGPLAAAALLGLLAGNMRLVFALSAVPALLCLLVLAAFVKEVKPEGRHSEVDGTVLSLRPFDRVFLAYLAIVVLFTLGNSSDAFILLRAGDMGLSAPLVPIAWVVLHIVKMLTSMPAGILSDKIGRRKLIIAGWAVYAMVYAGFAVGHAPMHAWVLFAVYGVYFGFTEGVEKAFVADLVPADLRATAYGAFNFAVGIGALPASVLMGLLWNSYGPKWAFGFGAAMAMVASLLLTLLVREGRQV